MIKIFGKIVESVKKKFEKANHIEKSWKWRKDELEKIARELERFDRQYKSTRQLILGQLYKMNME